MRKECRFAAASQLFKEKPLGLEHNFQQPGFALMKALEPHGAILERSNG
jgi:hypothetical protein